MSFDRLILHSDMNCFYASVECLHRPQIRDYPVIVGGDEEARHGIVLAKNQVAKAYGIKTGETLRDARKKCPDAIVVPPNYRLYMRFSRMAREIYYHYTDKVEPFGLDEAWLDVTDSAHLWGGDATVIAQEISERIKFELGITVSIGVSWNKIFAKFGSDYKKPDAITVITRENYRSLVWNAPVEDLLYVGRATKAKLNAYDIYTIGDLACADPHVLQMRLGKIGLILLEFARGNDDSPVKPLDPHKGDVHYDIKSVGNGLTAPHDLTCPKDAKALVYALSESVAQRLREYGFLAQTVAIHVRDSQALESYTRQAPLARPSNLTQEIAQVAYELLEKNEPLNESRPLRSLGVRATQLTTGQPSTQLDIFGVEERRRKLLQLDLAIDKLRSRFGNAAVRRGIELADVELVDLDIKRDNVVHPVGYFS